MTAPPNSHDASTVDRRAMGERLRAAREYLGFSQDEVARYLGIPRTALSNIETGQRRLEALELTKLATLYKRPVNYFTGGESSAEESFDPDVEHLARKAASLSQDDRAELSRFADFLKSRGQVKEG